LYWKNEGFMEMKVLWKIFILRISMLELTTKTISLIWKMSQNLFETLPHILLTMRHEITVSNNSCKCVARAKLYSKRCTPQSYCCTVIHCTLQIDWTYTIIQGKPHGMGHCFHEILPLKSLYKYDVFSILMLGMLHPLTLVSAEEYDFLWRSPGYVALCLPIQL
jgi:hypothetical protein